MSVDVAHRLLAERTVHRSEDTSLGASSRGGKGSERSRSGLKIDRISARTSCAPIALCRTRARTRAKSSIRHERDQQRRSSRCAIHHGGEPRSSRFRRNARAASIARDRTAHDRFYPPLRDRHVEAVTLENQQLGAATGRRRKSNASKWPKCHRAFVAPAIVLPMIVSIPPFAIAVDARDDRLKRHGVMLTPQPRLRIRTLITAHRDRVKSRPGPARRDVTNPERSGPLLPGEHRPVAPPQSASAAAS